MESWNYQDLRRLDPHRFDYKRRIRDDSVPEILKYLRREPCAEPLPLLGTLRWIQENSDLVFYRDSASKDGIMVQASCIMTTQDALGSTRMASAGSGSAGIPTHVVIQRRANAQFHDPGTPRHLSGGACLIGTVAGRVTTFADTPHLSTDIFTRLVGDGVNPLALFGRKLLLPTPDVEARFLGLGFNITGWPASRRGYLHLIWQVVVDQPESLARSIIVPERESSTHDVITVVPSEHAMALLDQKALIDAAALESVLKPCCTPVRFGGPDAGLLHTSMFSHSRGPGPLPSGATYSREAIIFDLLRLFQTAVHRGQVSIAGTSEEAFRLALKSYLDNLAQASVASIQVDDRTTSGPPDRRSEHDLRVKISPTKAAASSLRPQWEYIIECKVTDDPAFSKQAKALAQCREYSAREIRRFAPQSFDNRIECVILVMGVRSAQSSYAMGGVEVIDNDHQIYGIRVALDVNPPSRQRPLARVAHAVIPARAKGRLGIVILQPESEGAIPANPRLPGGRLNYGKEADQQGYEGESEPAEAGLRRELGEEIDLRNDMVRDLDPIRPVAGSAIDDRPFADPYFTSTATSSKTGQRTTYQLNVFLPKLTSPGVATLARLVGEGRNSEGARVLLVDPKDWETTGLGYDSHYARDVLRAIGDTRLERAAILLDESLPKNAKATWWAGETEG
jgi:8-oxo-dGTP pyrophosphatase MutT (NUDIX family)